MISFLTKRIDFTPAVRPQLSPREVSNLAYSLILLNRRQTCPDWRMPLS